MMTNPYGTHLPILLKVVEATKGDVLELGIGSSSTPALHKICLEQNRRLDSYDMDVHYVDQYSRQHRSPNHSYYWIDDWSMAGIDRPWSVALIDHRPAARRRIDAVRLKDFAEYIVIHDTEPTIDRFYRFESIWKHFRHIFHDDQIPRTTVVSNFNSLDWLEGDNNGTRRD
jgi:hypothetical protein